MKVTFCLVAATLFWAGNYVVGHSAVTVMSPLDLTYLRWLFAVAPLLALAQLIERPDWRAALKSWRWILLMGVLGLAAYTLLLYAALQYTTALNASLINAANPAVIVVLAVVFLRERPRWTGYLGLLLGLVGVLLILTNGRMLSIFSLSFNQGDLLMVAAIVVWGLYSVAGRRLREVPPTTSTALQVLLTVLLLTPFAVAFGVHLPATSDASWALAYIALFPSVGSYLLWNIALKTTAPSTAGNFLNLITVFTALISLLLGQQMTLVQVIGGAVVLTGVLLTSRRGRPKVQAGPPTHVPEPSVAPQADGNRPDRRR